jgi:Bacterial Ig-like domain (group 3)/FG-GAP-like repeat
VAGKTALGAVGTVSLKNLSILKRFRLKDSVEIKEVIMKKFDAVVHQCHVSRCGTKAFVSALIWIASIGGLGAQAYASTNQTTTNLSVSSTSMAAGTVLTLTATVTGAHTPVTKGQVTFCDATATHCDGAAVFGVARVTSNHTAAIKLTLGVGIYSIQAVFANTLGASGSTSASHAVTVTGAANYASSTTIAATGNAGDYTLSSEVTFFGKAAATGTISFLDASESDALVSSAPLNPATLADIFTPAAGSPLTAENAQFVVSGDFNNDGIPDLAVLNSAESGTVGVYLGKGNGTFQSSVDYNVGTFPFAMAVGDVNGDGKLDLIVANYSDGTVGVLLGNGDGTFQGQTTFATEAGPESVAVGDFNHDGWLDLAVTDSGTGEVSILLGNGDGTFQAEVPYSVPNPEGIAVGDFNHDGILDLAVTGVAQGAILDILLGVGDGTFQAESFIPLPANAFARWLAVGDLRKNGIQDVVVPDLDSSNVYVFLGNNDGTFQDPVTYAVTESSDGITLGDVNGDGILDLVVPDTGGCACDSLKTVAPLPGHRDRVEPGIPIGGVVSVLLGNGDGTFAAKTDYTVGSAPDVVALADFNGDGLLDIATSDLQSNTATILLAEKTETAEATGQAVYGTGIHNVFASYPGDTDRAPSQSTTVPLTAVPQVATATALAIDPNPGVFGQSITLTGTVSPTPTGVSLGTISFHDGTTLLGSGNVDSSGVATFTTANLAEGSHSIVAKYSGDEKFIASTSASKNLTVKTNQGPTYTVTAPVAPAVVVQGGAVAVKITVPPLGGAFNSVVTLSASGLPLGATATFNPATVTPGSAGATTVMTIQLATLAASIPVRQAPANHGGLPGTTFSLAFVLFGVVIGRKRLPKALVLVFVLGSLGVLAAFLTGCNGGFASTPPTQAGKYTVTVTGTSGSFTASTKVTLVVQ